jgi:hypothetical protein
MSETTNGTGGFGQFSDRYRDRWAALHPKAAPASAPTPTPLNGPLHDAAVVQQEQTSGTSGDTVPKRHPAEVRVDAAPFGRRRTRPG